MNLRGRLILEAVGTYFLMLVIALVTIRNAPVPEAAFAIGAVLIAIVYAIGPHSWAHFNPSMSLAFWLRGTMPGREVAPYVIAQVCGALLAVFTQMLLVLPESEFIQGVPKPITSLPETNHLSLVIGELLFTFALVFTTLHVATTRLQRGNAYFGLVVASIVVAGILTMGPVASAVFNPAVQIGFWAMGSGGVTDGVLIVGSSLVGGALAAFGFRLVHGASQDPE
ncbi:MAG: aquaporin [Planctomycetota bacterium]|nr:aquaporin [Planctomycetota bacterium]